jgi:hypothetical protein
MLFLIVLTVIATHRLVCRLVRLNILVTTGTQSLIRHPWDQTRFGNRNFSGFGMVFRGIRGQKLRESIAQLISTNW